MVYLFLSLFFSIDAVCFLLIVAFIFLFIFRRCYSEMEIAQYDTKLGENAFITKAELRPCFQACQGMSFRE